MNKYTHYILTPNRRPSFKLDLLKIENRMTSIWNNDRYSFEIVEGSPYNILNFRINDNLEEEELLGGIAEDATFGFQSVHKSLLFDFVIWIVNYYPEDTVLYFINDIDLAEYLELSPDTEKKQLEDIFVY